MSLGSRATKGGAKTAGKDGKAQDKGKGPDKTQPKDKVKPQATTEQLRMAHMIDRKNEDGSDIRRMVLELMEMTCRTEEEVCSALHDSDNDMAAACNLLLEESQRIQGEWRTSEKKKKKPPAAAGNGEAEPPRDPRASSSGRPRRGEGEGMRGRGSARGRGGGRGMARGLTRGGRRGGPRPRPPRDPAFHADHAGGNNIGDSFPTTEDWDNEEWSGSLADTKVHTMVFTPSSNAQNANLETDLALTQPSATEDWDCSPETNGPSESHIPTYTYHSSAQHHHSYIDQMSSNSGQIPSVPVSSEPPATDVYHAPQHHQPMGMSGSLSAAQSQYLSQLTQQSQRHDTNVYTTNYGVYGSTDMSSQRKPQRARVPPPSKIPVSAVEMPGGAEPSAGMFLDVQFGALDPEQLQEPPLPNNTNETPSQPESTQQPVTTSHETRNESPTSYGNHNSVLNESSMSVVEPPAPVTQSVASLPPTSNTTSSLEKQITATMKQLSVSGVSGVSGVSAVSGVSSVSEAVSTGSNAQPSQATTYSHHRPKTMGQQNVYAHHTVTHHPPVYGGNVYAPQVNSSNASLTANSAMTATPYANSATLTQYQPIMNSYQQTSSSAGVYGGSALYTAAPYTAYQPTHQPKMQTPKDTPQYDSSVASSNSLTSTSTTQASTAKVVTTTVSGGVAGASNVSAGGASGAGANAYAASALYGAGGVSAPAAYAYDEQLMRGTMPHHMGGYYEMGYGVSGAREGTFGLGAGERFGRTDAASPQQVPAALPPGYAYFYQPPPTSYQYGVYPTYGGTSNVAGSAAGKVNTYTQQQPPYEAQDTYKPGGPYNANANKTTGAASADLTNAMYATKHVALNKVNSYDKAAFHSGTPPPFGAGSHLYIPPPHHLPHHHAHHQESGTGAGARSGGTKAPSSKPTTYSQSYWAPN